MHPKHDRLFFKLIKSGKLVVDKNGRVFDKDGVRLDKKIKRGYYRVTLYINKEVVGIQAHRLVYMYFNKVCLLPSDIMNHLDGNKGNNKLSNLEVGTYSSNSQHAVDSGLFKFHKEWRSKQRKAKQGELNVMAAFSNDRVKKIRKQFEAGKISVSEILKKYSISERTAEHLLSGVTYENVGGPLCKNPLGKRVGKIGRKPKLSDDDCKLIITRLSKGELQKDLASEFKLDKATLSKRLTRFKKGI